MPASSLDAALARGATVVTPNDRLAREVVARHDRAQLQRHREAWPGVEAMPWRAFVGTLWQEARDADLPGLARHAWDATQCAWLWHRIVAADLGDSAPLVNAEEAGTLAAEAWELVHAWGAGGESWRGFANAGDDAAAFARWAGAFVRELRRHDALDSARAVEALAASAPRLPGIAQRDIALTGFLELSPQQQRLIGALRAAGAHVDVLEPAHAAATAAGARLASARTPRDEIASALVWARDQALADPAAVVGVVVLDLAERREAVRALAEDLLCPSLQWPGHAASARPYEISAADALGNIPWVRAALDLIALVHGELAVSDVARLLSAPYWPEGDGCWPARARLEATWLAEGRRTLRLVDVGKALESCDRALAARWRQLLALRLPGRATPRAWTEHWRRILDLGGLADGRSLASAEFQARRAWQALLQSIARLSPVSGELARSDALATLRRLATTTTHQPEAGGGRIRILGLLEAAGLAFDALWVAGLAAEAWPAAPNPNPLLPLAWQRERGVPRSHPARELEYATAVTALLARSAPAVVFSYAAQRDDHPSAPSPLIAGLPPLASPITMIATSAERQFAAKPPLERCADERAPRFPAGARLRGGAGMIEAQSACPFRATARHRLRAEAWPEAVNDLTPLERGSLLHAALAAAWRELQDQAELNARNDAELATCVAVAVARAVASFDARRWAQLPPIVAEGERERLQRTVMAWLTTVDRARPPFRVVATELALPVALAGHALELKLDRVDRLADGTAAIIDYKSGVAIPPERWFDARPAGPQLALYALAWQQGNHAPPVRALVYGQLKPGAMRPVGLAATADGWPGLASPEQLRTPGLADWPAAEVRWTEALTALAQAIATGDARVDPRDTKTCTQCDLGALCRIGAFAEGATASDGEDADG